MVQKNLNRDISNGEAESMRCLCGMEVEPDEKTHTRTKEHLDYVRGPKISVIAKVESCAEYSGFRLFDIDAKVPDKHRKSLSRVAMVAYQNYPSGLGFRAGYYGGKTERIFLAATYASQIVSFVVTAPEDRFWPLLPVKGQLKDDGEPGFRDGFAIARVWTAYNCRKRGLSRRLIELAAERLPCEFGALGWQFPLTDDGKALAMKIHPQRVWACGSAAAVEETCRTANPS